MNTSYNTDTTDYKEGKIARAIESKTAKLPSDVFLWAAGASIIGSLGVQVVGMLREGRIGRRFGIERNMMRAPLANFIGQWAPTLLILGLYNKIVKVAGSDRMSR